MENYINMDQIEEEDAFNLDEEVFEDNTDDEDAIPIEIQVSSSVSCMMEVIPIKS